MQTIEIIGSIDGQCHYDRPYIAELLQSGLQSLVVGTEFMGRPGTLVYANQNDVIKIASDLNFTAMQAAGWVQQTLQKERQMAVHHPHKTWLLIGGEGGECFIASACPRLSPLHVALKSAQDGQYNLALLTAAFKLYLTLAKTSGEKLDEGLSNFAVSADGQVYYLDDEYYAWDDFVAFSIMLGVFIRNSNWIDLAFIDGLGHNLAILLQAIFQDGECRRVIAEQLQTLFMPNEEKEQLLKRLIKSLLQTPATALDSGAGTALVQATTAARTADKRLAGRYIALLADIHANYSALSCVLDYLEAEGIHEGIVLGDIVGYGPEPKECIERLRNSPFQIIKGNHDDYVASGERALGFSNEAKAVIDWTVGHLSADERGWLNGLPPFMQQDEWYAVHGAPMDSEHFHAYVYTMTYQDNLDYMQQNGMGLCFHGHSHMPGVFARRQRSDEHTIRPLVDLAHYQQALVCPGSIGQPRNGCTDTQFAIYDREQRRVVFMALPYDHEAVIAKMRLHGLPEGLALRLSRGV